MHIYLLLILFVISIILIILYNYHHKKESYISTKNDEKKIPKKIWSYWHDSKNKPFLVDLSFKSWKHFHPTFEIYILDEHSLNIYFDKKEIEYIKKAKTQQRKSDMIRIFLLEKYGGIWIDASILLFQSLEKWMPFDSYDFIGFEFESWTLDPRFPVIESWFLASPPENDLMKRWKTEMMDIINKGDDKYLEKLKKNKIHLQKIRSPKYLIIHCALQFVLQMNQSQKYQIYKMNAEKTAYKYITQNNWNPKKAVDYITTKDDKDIFIIKLRSSERPFFHEKNIKKNSILDRLMNIIAFRRVPRTSER